MVHSTADEIVSLPRTGCPVLDCPGNWCHFRPVKWTPQYHTACQIQKKILAMMGLEMQQQNQTPKESKIAAPKLKPAELCSLTKAWTELEERKRILRMKGLPKAVEVKPKEKGQALLRGPRE